MDRAELEHLIELGLSERELAARLGVSQTTARRWLDRHGLATARALQRRTRPTGLADGERVDLVCPTHGVTAFVLRSDGGRRCLRCRSEAVSRRRRKVKQILGAEA